MNNINRVSWIIASLLLVSCSSIQQDQNQTTGSNKAVKPEAPVVDEVSKVSPALQSLLNSALQQQQQGDLNAAIVSLERAIRIAPRYPESYYQLGVIRYEQGQYNLAKSLAQKALSLGATDTLQTQSLQLAKKASQ